ncbi:hypothetical protein EV421DRAFT_1797342, partial [Armillaria borealis]
MSGRMLVIYIFHILPPGVSPLYGSIDGVCSLLICLNIGSEILQVSRGDGKDGKSGGKKEKNEGSRVRFHRSELRNPFVNHKFRK